MTALRKRVSIVSVCALVAKSRDKKINSPFRRSPQTESTNSLHGLSFFVSIANFRQKMEAQYFYLDYRQTNRTCADVRGLEEASFP